MSRTEVPRRITSVAPGIPLSNPSPVRGRGAFAPSTVPRKGDSRGLGVGAPRPSGSPRTRKRGSARNALGHRGAVRAGDRARAAPLDQDHTGRPLDPEDRTKDSSVVPVGPTPPAGRQRRARRQGRGAAGDVVVHREFSIVVGRPDGAMSDPAGCPRALRDPQSLRKHSSVCSLGAWSCAPNRALYSRNERDASEEYIPRGRSLLRLAPLPQARRSLGGASIARRSTERSTFRTSFEARMRDHFTSRLRRGKCHTANALHVHETAGHSTRRLC
jgi:hypothetical protein